MAKQLSAMVLSRHTGAPYVVSLARADRGPRRRESGYSPPLSAWKIDSASPSRAEVVDQTEESLNDGRAPSDEAALLIDRDEAVVEWRAV